MVYIRSCAFLPSVGFVTIFYSNISLCFEHSSIRNRDIFVNVVAALVNDQKAPSTIERFVLPRMFSDFSRYALKVWDTQWEESISKASFVKLVKDKIDPQFHSDSKFDAKWQVNIS